MRIHAAASVKIKGLSLTEVVEILVGDTLYGPYLTVILVVWFSLKVLSSTQGSLIGILFIVIFVSVCIYNGRIGELFKKGRLLRVFDIRNFFIRPLYSNYAIL